MTAIGAEQTHAISNCLTASFRGVHVERVRFIFLDHAGKVLGERILDSHHPRLVQVMTRDVTSDAIRLEADAVVMAHNHPSGDPNPSRRDIEVTRRLWTILDAIGVRLIDHLVVAANGVVSLRDRGLM